MMKDMGMMEKEVGSVDSPAEEGSESMATKMSEEECQHCCDVLDEAKAIQGDAGKMAQIKIYLDSKGKGEDKSPTSFDQVRAMGKKKLAKY